MSVVSVYLTLFNEARQRFGRDPATWNSHVVGRWMEQRMVELRCGAKPTAQPYQPRNFVDVEPVDVGRWDDVEDL